MEEQINKFKLVKSLLEEAIKEKKTLNNICKNKNLSHGFVNDFLRRLPKYFSEKEKNILVKLKEKYDNLMKYGTKSVKEDEKKRIAEIYYSRDLSWDEKITKLCEMFDKSERRIRQWLVELGFKHKQDVLPEQLIIAKDKKLEKGKKIFLVTSAQNATPVNEKMLLNMEAYAKHLKAQLLVIPYRLKNPTSVFTDKQENDDWWDESIVKYLCVNRLMLNKHLAILGDIKIQPTANMPLNGLNSLNGEHSSIVGHPRIHMKVLPYLPTQKPKILMSTGTITKPNFSDSKIGKVSEFHSSYGFVIAEVEDNETYHTRQVSCENNGSFYDLFYHVTNGTVNKIKEVPCIVLGDLHLPEEDKVIMKVKEKLFKTIKPKTIVLHDLCSNLAINHHELDNPYQQYKRISDGTISLKKELDYVLEWIGKMKNYNLVVVKSNHDVFIEKFLLRDWRRHPHNALEYFEYGKLLLENKATNGILAYVINKKYPKVKCLGNTESFKVKGVELGLHGDFGVSGAKGSLNSFKSLNTKMVGAHTHSPLICDGYSCCGTNSLLNLGYNDKGLTTWHPGDVIIHENGKRQTLLFQGKNKEFTMLK